MPSTTPRLKALPRKVSTVVRSRQKSRDSRTISPDGVYSLLTQIPVGSVTTYGEIARALNSRAFRAVGKILNRNPNAPTVPCHRVVMSNGTLGGYAFGVERKIALLRDEGVEINNNVVVDFQRRLHRFSRN